MKTLNKNTKNRTIMKYHTVTSLKLIITLVFLCGISIKGWTQETSLSATDENGLTWTFKTNSSTSNSFYHKAYDVIPADPSQLIGPIEVPCSLEVEGVSYPVLRMGLKAFNGCTQMTSLTLPKTVNSLYSKYMIFDGCTGLKKLDLSKISISSFPTRWFASDQANTQAVGLEEIWLPKVTARNPYTVNLFQYQTFKKVYFHEDQPKCTSSCFSALAALTGTVKNCVFYFPNEEAMNSFKKADNWKDLLGDNMLLEIMNGIEVLSKSEIKTISTSSLLIMTFVCIFIILTGLFISISIFDVDENLAALVLSTALLVLFFMVSKSLEKSTGKYEYKVTISDEVSLNEFYDKYEIVDQDGKIYTIKEK